LTDTLKLADILLARQPRETSGGLTANRFAYQCTWALCKLLQLHDEAGDYVLIMEFHDDVLVLNSSTSPTSADFYQLKTAGKMWKLTPLLAFKNRGKGAVPVPEQNTAAARSILGRLVEHATRFGAQHTGSMSIVSNAKFGLDTAIPPPCHERQRFCLADLATDALGKVRAHLKNELGLQEEPSLHNVFLVTSGISLTDHTTHGVGAVAEFLERRKPGGLFAVQPLFRALRDELTRRATHEWQPTSFADLCERKGINRATLDSFLAAAVGHFDAQAEFSAVRAQLVQENMPFRALLLIERGWRRYQVERMDESNAAVQTLRTGLLPILKSTLERTDWSALIDLVRVVREAYSLTLSEQLFETSYIEGAILFELKYIESGSLQAAGAQFETGLS
jgi:hypothetical protein